MTNPLNAAEWTREVPNARSGALKSVEVTLNATPGNVTTVAIPENAQGVRLNPSADVRFAIGEDPEAIAQESGASVAVGDLAVGDTAIQDEWTKRLLETGTDRDLRLIGAAGGETVVVVFF